MSELLMFLGTLAVGGIWLLVMPQLCSLLPDEPALRLGLWMNGIDGKDADDIVEHHKTGKLPQ
jgi:hypothetical protein